MAFLKESCFFALLTLALAGFLFAVGCNDGSGGLLKDTLPDQEDVYPLGEYYDPGSPGPYKVGVTTFTLVDHSRGTLLGKMPRTLLTEVWYPITMPDGKINTLGDMIGELPYWTPDILEVFYGENWEEFLAIETSAFRDAEPFIPEHPFPVIFFSHGLTALRFQNFTLCEHLAGHGFLVVAPDHFDNTVFSNIPGHFTWFNPISTVTSEIQRPRDIAFLVKYLKARSSQPGTFLGPLVDPERFGLTGHSYGGMTSYMAGDRVKEIDAVSPLNPVIIVPSPETFTKPLLLLVGDNDNMASSMFNSCEVAEDHFYSHQGNKAFLYLLNSGHYSATDACLLLPEGLIDDNITGCGGEMISSDLANKITGAYQVAFFSATLKQDNRYLEYLGKNNFPQNLEYNVFWDQE